MKKLTIMLIVCMGMTLLAGCGGKAAESTSAAPAATEAATTEAAKTEAATTAAAPETEAASEELQEYVAEGVGTFYFPEGWEMEVYSLEEPLPSTYADFSNGDLHIHGTHFGMDAYEAAGVPLPADVEEYSQRDGVRRSVPEDAEFAYDDFGNYYTEFVEDGTVTYHVLKQGEDCMGDVILTYPEGTELPEGILEWISKATLG